MLLSCAVATMAQDNAPRTNGGQSNRGGGRGNFDPAQMQERMMQMTRERLEITDDTEWKAIQPLIEKVTAAQRSMFSDRMPRFMGRRGGEDRQGASQSGNDRRPPGMFGGGTPSPEVEALQRAVDGKASKSELKAAIEKVTAARKAKQAEVETAQENLRKVLTPRQEAIATLSGLL